MAAILGWLFDWATSGDTTIEIPIDYVYALIAGCFLVATLVACTRR